MYLIASTSINGTRATVAGALVNCPGDTTPVRELTLHLDIDAEASSGVLELACLKTLLEMIPVSPTLILLFGCSCPELGGQLFTLLGQEVGVVAVSETPSVTGFPVTRGNNPNLLFVTPLGIDPEVAADLVEKLHGKNRTPTLLGYVSSLIQN